MKLSYRNPKNAVAVAAYWGKSLDKPDWYEVKAQSGDTIEVFIFDVIGWPFTDISSLVRSMAAEKDKPILARINSPGGDVFDGMSLFNAFANHPGGVTVRIEGLAASIASVVAMGGRKVEAYQNTMLMVHNAWTVVGGDHNFMREVADLIEKISGQMLEVYTGKTKSGKKDMKQMMDDETWMTAKEAAEKGFIDTVLTSGKAAKAAFDLSMFAHVPDEIRAENDHEPTEREIERVLRDVGLSKSKAKKALALLAGCSQEPKEAELIAACQKTLTVFGG
jgi:ATP-dependent protease ClpP protease subunit